jgi:hypothetical protein
MGGDSQNGNGCTDPAQDQGREEEVMETGGSIAKTIDSMRFAQAGFHIPSRNTVLDPLRFWELTDEGWRFVVGEDGAILAYMPPKLGDRLARLTETKNLDRARKQLYMNRRGHRP